MEYQKIDDNSFQIVPDAPVPMVFVVSDLQARRDVLSARILQLTSNSQDELAKELAPINAEIADIDDKLTQAASVKVADAEAAISTLQAQPADATP